MKESPGSPVSPPAEKTQRGDSNRAEGWNSTGLQQGEYVQPLITMQTGTEKEG